MSYLWHGYCAFCGRRLILVPGEKVCAYCIEDPIYLQIQAHNARVERLKKLARQRLQADLDRDWP